MKTFIRSVAMTSRNSQSEQHKQPRGSTTPWAVTWLTWPFFFALNVGLAVRSIMQHGNYSSVLTTLLIMDVVVLVTLEFLFPVRRQWKMTWQSLVRDLKYIVARGTTFAVVEGLFGLASIRLNAGHVGPITDWPLYLSVPAALLVAEFLNYWQHRWSHESSGALGSFLWRSHASHHLPEQVYVLMHPASMTLQKMLSRTGWMFLLLLVLAVLNPALKVFDHFFAMEVTWK